MGKCYEKNIVVDSSDAQAVYWYLRAGEAGCSAAYCKAGKIHKRAQDYKEAVHCFTLGAKDGCAVSQYRLGDCYEHGRGVEQNYQQAFEWYLASARGNYSSGMVRLSQLYREGHGVAQDLARALFYIKLAAETGDRLAQYNLACHYDIGDIVAQCAGSAFEWYRKAAKRGHISASYNLAICFRDAHGTLRSHKEAYRWMAKATIHRDRGDALCGLGLCYYKGLGTVQDYAKAFTAFTDAVNLGYKLAYYPLAKCYEKNRGHTLDYRGSLNEAKKYYKLSAETDDVRAQAALGSLLCDESDYAQALVWLRRAVSHPVSHPVHILHQGRVSGVIRALITLSNCYNTGRGVSESGVAAYLIKGLAGLGLHPITYDVQYAFIWNEEPLWLSEAYYCFTGLTKPVHGLHESEAHKTRENLTEWLIGLHPVERGLLLARRASIAVVISVIQQCLPQPLFEEIEPHIISLTHFGANVPAPKVCSSSSSSDDSSSEDSSDESDRCDCDESSENDESSESNESSEHNESSESNESSASNDAPPASKRAALVRPCTKRQRTEE